MIKKSIESLPWAESSHGFGQKRVLLSENETATNITQVAIISLKAGEEGKEHMHWKIEEGFYVLKGELILQADRTNHILHAGDYLHLRMATIHNLKLQMWNCYRLGAKSENSIVLIGNQDSSRCIKLTDLSICSI